ncbi:transposase [Oceanobacillus halotolerans]|uniref:transposase n=1 Tax=Oceanobacillus halotolerans TaxID=2663380 RepID=UPI0013DCDB85|nr:transposase [Oceanobacillus halotolerans]
MKLLIISASIVMPILMIIMQRKRKQFHTIFHIFALLAALVFGNIASIAIYTILKDNTVFMTNIHALFLNPYFLITGAYLGVYLLYILTLQIIHRS